MSEGVRDTSDVGHEGGLGEASGRRIFTATLFRVRKGHGFTFTEEPPPPPPEPARRPARIAVTLAVAHKLQAAIDAGLCKDRADTARKLGLTRARVTQLLDLLLLAPDIQEAILFLEATDGREPLGERGLRGIVRLQEWGEQRRVWARSVRASSPGGGW